jgi:hypothetical protein
LLFTAKVKKTKKPKKLVLSKDRVRTLTTDYLADAAGGAGVTDGCHSAIGCTGTTSTRPGCRGGTGA